jgi:osmotically-inducible protein OsmY
MRNKKQKGQYMKTNKLNEWLYRKVTGRGVAVVLIAATMQTVILTPLMAASAEMEFTASAINSAVESDLHFEMPTFPNFLDVDTQNGIVTLSGSVDNMLAKRRAVNIAESVRGVLGVINQITVKPMLRSDEDIRKDILLALLNDPATESYKVSVSVTNAVVTLTGTVGSMAESRLAQRVAEGVSGVIDTHNDITINYAAKRTDQEISADIQAVLHWDIWMVGYPIQVGVKNGNVTLTGTVGSVIEKSRAEQDAWVNGVWFVDDSGLKVEPTARDRMRRTVENPVRSDSEIKTALLKALHADPRVSPYADMINVTVEVGVPILDGSVGDLKAKSSAGADARDIVGVSDVDNELSVRPNENLPDDAETQKGLQAALHWDPLLDGVHIEAAVFNHVAYLNGYVDSADQKTDAEDLASCIKGVIEVRNHLKIESEPDYFFYNQPIYDFETFGPPPLKSDAQIKKNIERKFFWSPFVHRNDITVKVDNGVARLTGTVGTWIGYEEAYQDARKGGALEVIDRVNVK